MTLADVRQKLENDQYAELLTFRDDVYKVLSRGLCLSVGSPTHKRAEEVCACSSRNIRLNLRLFQLRKFFVHQFSYVFRVMDHCCAEQLTRRQPLTCTLCRCWIKWGGHYYRPEEQPSDERDCVICEICYANKDTFHFAVDDLKYVLEGFTMTASTAPS